MNTKTEWLALLAAPDLADARLALLVVLLLLAAFIDVRSYRIPNWLTVGGAVLGLGLNTAIAWHSLSAAWALDGFLWALGGMAAGLVIMLPMYALRVMAAGDVKLMAMAGAFVGWPDILFAILCSLIAGGAAALAFAVYRRALGRLAGNVAHIVQSVAFAAATGLRGSPMAGRASVGRIPYAACAAVGTTAWLGARLLGYV